MKEDIGGIDQYKVHRRRSTVRSVISKNEWDEEESGVSTKVEEEYSQISSESLGEGHLDHCSVCSAGGGSQCSDISF